MHHDAAGLLRSLKLGKRNQKENHAVDSILWFTEAGGEANIFPVDSHFGENWKYPLIKYLQARFTEKYIRA